MQKSENRPLLTTRLDHYYRIVVTNTGTANVTTVVINDATPAYTTALTTPAATYTDATGATIVLPAANQPTNGAAGSYTFRSERSNHAAPQRSTSP